MELLHIKHYIDGIGILEMKILKVKKDQFHPEGIKYSLTFARERGGGNFEGDFVRYDNYNKEGHHKHIKGKKYKYEFLDIDTLILDFKTDVINALREEGIEIDIF